MICWARYLFIGVVAIPGVGHMVAACGQKGDLYLPAPEQTDEAQRTADGKPGIESAAEEQASDVPEVPAQEETLPEEAAPELTTWKLAGFTVVEAKQSP